ncbi:MAG: methyltransferase domain-containing protein [Planctomycetaceae bacterium]|nr:methyltransferase domain-containing protein [Planctomycetaceae bacterium]
MTVTRLQIGTSRLEKLPADVRSWFLDKSWMNFGDGPDMTPRTFRYYLRQYPLRMIVVGIGQRLFSRRELTADPSLVAGYYEATNFQEWFFRRGDRLTFDDNSLGFIFSEHFFEHLFLDEAVSLMRECARTLKRGGVIRTVVPDADLRTYEKPEPVGFPFGRLPFTDPRKHKTRWSVYMLAQALECAGLRPVPIRYCDRNGTFVDRDPASLDFECGPCADPHMVQSLQYVIKQRSLIIDGVKT